VYLSNPQDVSIISRGDFRTGSLPASRFLLLALVLTSFAVAADQFAAPILHTSSPLWATAACLLLVWRRGDAAFESGETPMECPLSTWRVACFVAAHVAFVLFARSVSAVLQSVAGSLTMAGTLVAVWKMSVLVPILTLLPLSQWKKLARMYRAEGIAALVVLLTYFPGRALEGIWPWYGQALGRVAYTVSRLFVSGAGYISALNPTVTGSQLSVTILKSCSGITGIELFDYLFSVVIIVDWNRLHKGRALAGYFAGVAAMLLGNVLRISSFVVLGNHGLAGLISQYHISAGWIFFTVVFLVYLLVAYPRMLNKRESAKSILQAT